MSGIYIPLLAILMCMSSCLPSVGSSSMVSEERLRLKETFNRPDKHILRPGDRLSLKCVATGNPLPTITWTLDSLPVPETHRIQYGDYVSMKGDVVSYVNTSNVGQEDAGIYRCEARNDAGSVFHSEQVFVSGPPFIKPMGNMTVLAGDSVSIMCPVTGYPIHRITWIKGGRELPSTERHRVYDNGTLFISDASRELDEGVYVCRATSDKGESHSRNLYLSILKKPTISPFRFPATLTEGMSVITTCSILTGDAPIHVDWFKDGSPLDLASLNIHRNEMGDLGSSLVFRSVGPSHAGNYTCSARNRVGEDRFSALMVVRIPPKWKIEPTDQSAVVGDRVTFDCMAEGYPPPLIRWKISTENGQRSEFKSISSNYHIQTLENGSLTIKEVNEKDGASYLCEAGNGVGAELTSVVKLTVHVRAHFKSNFQVVRVSKGKPLKVLCEAYGEAPLHIKWAKDRTDVDLEKEPKYTIKTTEQAEGIISELTAPTTGRGDSGTFICITWNPFGRAEMNHRVLVEEVPDAPFDLKVVELGSKGVTLRWSPPFTGNLPLNKYIIQWKRDKDSWASNSFSSEIGSSSNQIFITDLKPLTTYSLRVFAVNPLGDSESSQTVTIKTEEEAPGTAPLSLRVEPLSSKSVRVKWKTPKHIESFGSVIGYYIGYKTVGSDKFTFKTVEIHPHSKLEATVTNLKKSTMYTFSVSAFNSKGTGPASAEVTGKTLDKDPPSPPHLNIVSVGATAVSLGWSLPEESSPVNGYRVFLRSNSEDWKSHETLAEGKVSSHTIRGLKCGTKYQVYMLAFNEVGNSDPSESLAFSTEGGAPVAPEKSSFLTLNSSFILLHLSSWRSTSCPINNFIIQFKSQGSNEWTLLSNTVNPILDTFLLPDLHSGTWYNLLIGAHSDAGSTEAEYLFATLTDAGATVAPLSVSSSSFSEEGKMRRYLQMFLPVISIFVAFVVILVLLLLLTFRRQRLPGQLPPLSGDGGTMNKMDGRSMSMSSVGKVVYESVQRGVGSGCDPNENTRNNLVYCPSPYATTRVSLFFPSDGNHVPAPSSLGQMNHPSGPHGGRGDPMVSDQNCYDMPLIKQPQMTGSDDRMVNTMCDSFPQQMLMTEAGNLIDVNQDPRSFQR